MGPLRAENLGKQRAQIMKRREHISIQKDLVIKQGRKTTWTELESPWSGTGRWRLPGASAMRWAAALPLKVPSPELTVGFPRFPTFPAPMAAHRGFSQPRSNFIKVTCNFILPMPSCFDRAGGRLKIISYVKSDLLAVDCCIPVGYLLTSSIRSVQTLLKVPKCCLDAVPHFPEHLCHCIPVGHTHCRSVTALQWNRCCYSTSLKSGKHLLLCQVSLYTCSSLLQRRVPTAFIH